MATVDRGFGPPPGSGRPAVGTDRPQPVFDMVRKGFNPNQVLEYLDRVAGLVQMLEGRIKQLESQLAAERRERNEALGDRPAQGSDPYEALAVRIADLMRSLDHDVERLRREAEAEAERIRAEARSDADRMRAEAELVEGEARAQAERLIGEARAEADRSMGDLATLRDATLNEFRNMRERMGKALREIEAVVEREPAEERIVVVDDVAEATTGEQSFRAPDIRT